LIVFPIHGKTFPEESRELMSKLSLIPLKFHEKLISTCLSCDYIIYKNLLYPMRLYFII